MSAPPAPTFPVVGLGGSAGGLHAFFEFFAALEALEERPGMAFIVVLHLAPDQESHLAELLAKRTRLSVRLVDAPAAVEIDTVYVIPPDRTLVVEGGMVVPRDRVKIGAHHPVDDLFHSLALAYGERAVGIVCSGTGSNGSLGAAAIREAGGWVLAQSPETAEFGEMPRRVIDTGMVDAVLAPDAMIPILRDSARRLAGGAGDTTERAAGEPAKAPTVADGTAGDDAAAPDPMKRILTTLRARANMDFRPYKPGMLTRRIERRQHIRGMPDLSAYADDLASRPEEVAALLDDLLITVTGFFRDPAAWNTLAETVVEPMFAAHNDEPLRAWVAGCATGEEAYSVAITLFEAAYAKGAERPIEIFATDASQRALSRARQGVYPLASIEGLSPERQQRWFTTEDDTARVKPELREAMIFAPQNLLQDPPFSRADLVVCRNLLIYLQADVQRRLMRLFHFALKEDGILFLGGAEGVGDAADLFEVVDKTSRIYRRVGPTRHDLVDFPVVRARRTPERVAVDPLPRPLLQRTTDHALKALADRYAPPSVIVDPSLTVLYYQGATDRYLRPQSGEPTHSLLSLARDGLGPHLRRVIDTAKQSGGPASVRVGVLIERGPVSLTIEAMPVPAAIEGAMMLVSFVEEATPPERGPSIAPAPPSTSREEELEAEVAMLRQEAAFGVETATRVAEDLKAYTEEITSMNEELRATNEELETSKEELQSLNEELQTVNSQLQAKVSELRTRTADLQNLLVSNDVATLFLGADLKLRWFSPKLQELFHVRDADVGRPISHLVRHFAGDALEEECRLVLQRLTPSEVNVKTEDGRTFVRRVMPYRTVDQRIDGLVVTFVDVSAIEDARLYAERVVETVPTPLLVLDRELHVQSANEAFYATFDATPKETVGRLVYDLGNGQWNIPELRRLLGEVLPDDELFEKHEVTHEFERIGRRTMLLNGRRLDHVQLILLAIEDITERKRAEAHQALLVSELAHRVKNALGVVQGMASQTLKRSASLKEFGAAFGGRLTAYARSHSQLLTREWKWQDLKSVVDSAVAAHAIDAARVHVDGPALRVSPQQALSIGLICHELETNAVKYGALSTPGGHIDIAWTVAGDGTVDWRWRECGGPPVIPPQRKGFGSVLIERLVEDELGGELNFDYRADGLLCSVTFSTSSGEDDHDQARTHTN